MKKGIAKFLVYTALPVMVVFAWKFFVPQEYDVPGYRERAGTSHWKLKSGSNIGYTLLKSQGKTRPTPVIYLHGGPGGQITNRDIQCLSTLARDGFNIYLYDQAGSGASGRLANINDYTVARHLTDLKEIIRIVSREKVILIGQSWGAILAVLYAAANPGDVEKLVLTSPGPVFPVDESLANNKPPGSYHFKKPFYTNRDGNKKAYTLRTKAIKYFATNFSLQISSNNEADDFCTYLNYEVNKSTVCDTANILPMNAGCGYYASIMTFNSLLEIKDPRTEIKKLKIPVLVLKGECDNQPWGYTNEYLTLIKNSRLVMIPGAGHIITVEQPGMYTDTIRQFIVQ